MIVFSNTVKLLLNILIVLSTPRGCIKYCWLDLQDGFHSSCYDLPVTNRSHNLYPSLAHKFHCRNAMD